MESVPNPYNPLEPVEHPAWFFGREAAFAFFRHHLVGVPLRHALVLIGRRGLGKSSLLRQLQQHVDERYRVCVIDLSLVDLRGEAGFFAALVDEIHLTLERAEVSTYRLPDWPQDLADGDSVNLRVWFRDVYLDVAITALRHRHLLIAFDDAHLLLEALDKGTLPADLPDYLAAVQAAYDRLDLAFALDLQHEDRALTVPLLADPALHYRLADLLPADAERLIREPVASVYSYDGGIVPRILGLVGGHPFLLTSICRLIFRRSEERHHAGSIIELDLIAVYPAALDQAGDIMRPLWRDASPNERLALVALARSTGPEGGDPLRFDELYAAANNLGYDMSQTQLASALRSLDYKGLVRMDTNGRYSFPALLIPRWLHANTEIPAPGAEQEAARPWAGIALIALAAIALVVVIGAAALSGVFSGDGDDESAGAGPGGPTVTLALNLEATRQADFATQTEQARPTATRPPTETPEPSATPRPTETPQPTAAATDTPSATPSPTNTRTPLPTDTPEPSATPITVASPAPTRSSRPTPFPTLDPGG